MHEIFYNTPLDIEIKSFTEVNGFIFPLSINISNIKYNIPSIDFLKVTIGDTPDKDVLEIGETRSPFKKQYDMNKYFLELKFIYSFIDWDLTDENFNTFRDLTCIEDSKDFIKWFMKCHMFNISTILRISSEIRYYIDCIKIDFIERMTKLLGLDKDAPHISFKDPSPNTPKEYIEFLSYNYNMTSFQTVFEFPTAVWFSENINKGYTDWSWREQEAKRMYVTAKTKIENFRETYKAKQLDNLKE